MQSRKRKNQAIERKKVQKRRTTAGIGVVILLIILAAAAWFVYDWHRQSWVMTFEGNRISTNDLRHFIDEVGWQAQWASPEQINEWAIDRLQESLAIISLGEETNLGMTDEEHDLIMQEIEEWPQELRRVSDNRIAEFASTFPVFWRLTDHFISDYDIDMDEIAEEMEMYVAMNLNRYAETEARFIFGMDRDELEGVREVMLVNPSTEFFDEAIRSHSWFYNEEEGIPITSIHGIVEFFEMPEHLSFSLFTLHTEDVSDVIEHGGGFLLVYVTDRNDVDPADVETSFIENETRMRRGQAMQEILDTRIENANIEINQRALDALLN